MALSITPSKMCGGIKISTLAILVIVIGLLLSVDRPLKSRAQGPGMSGGDTPLSTPWRPNKKDAKDTGPQACVKCHAEESARQHLTAMGRALELVATSEILRAHSRPTFRSCPSVHETVPRGARSRRSGCAGATPASEPILYSFG